MKHNRKNKPDGRHYPWINPRLGIEQHDYSAGHRGAAKGRRARKRRLRRDARREGKASLRELACT